MIITSYHRNAGLALRHLATLRRSHDYAEIVDRRNAAGRFSARGRYFTFEVRDEAEEKTIEYVLHFDYGDAKSKNLIRYQVHIIAPSGLKDSEVIAGVRARSKGEAWPKGWKKKAIYWSHPPKCELRSERLPKTLRKAAIGGGKASVSGRNPISQHRRSRKGKR